MLVALTGGTGFIGRHIANELVGRGHRVRCLARADGPNALRPDDAIERVTGDMEDERSLRQLVDGVDAVVHAAMYHEQRAILPSRTFRETYLRKNLSGGASLLEFAAQAKVSRFQLISTLEVYGSTLDPPLPARDESAPLLPDSLYGSVKYALETAGLTYGDDLDFQVVRPGWVFGDQYPFGRNCWHPIVERLKTGQEIPVEIGAYMIWVDDLAAAAVALLECEEPPHRIYNAHAGFVDWHHVTEVGRELLGSAAPNTGRPAPPSPRPIIADRIQGLGVAFRVEEGIAATLAHVARLYDQETNKGAEASGPEAPKSPS